MDMDLSSFLKDHQIPRTIAEMLIAKDMGAGIHCIAYLGTNRYYIHEMDSFKESVEEVMSDIYKVFNPERVRKTDIANMAGIASSTDVVTVNILYDIVDTFSENGTVRVRSYTNRMTGEKLIPTFYSSRGGEQGQWVLKSPLKSDLALVGWELPKVKGKKYDIIRVPGRESVEVLSDQVLIPADSYHARYAVSTEVQGDTIIMTHASVTRDYVLRETSEIRITKNNELKRSVKKEKLYWITSNSNGTYQLEKMQITPFMCKEAVDFFSKFEELRPKYSGSRVFISANGDMFLDILGKGYFVPINTRYGTPTLDNLSNVEFDPYEQMGLPQEIRDEITVALL